MIIDTLANLYLYKALSKRISKAINYISESSFEDMAPGKYPVKEDRIFCLVNQYHTKSKEECEMEAHQKYIDIQLMIIGEEIIGYKPLTNQTPTVDYKPNEDYALYNVDVDYLKLEKGMFAMFFPHDIHQPEIFLNEPQQVKKVIMKVMM